MANTKQEVQETGKAQAGLVVNNALIDGLTAQLKEKEKLGLTFPKDYNPGNALMGAYLVLKETTDKNKKCVLETCTPTSIANTLMDMVTMGLSMQKKQCYPVSYGGKLQCQISYHGNKTMAHRCGAKHINAEVIYDGDIFSYHIENGVKVIDKHEQDFKNVDNDKIIGAYCVVEMEDGSRYTEIMNMMQIKSAWKKGYGYKENGGVHTEFRDMMAKKTVTNRACRQIVQQFGDGNVSETYENTIDNSDKDVVSENVEYEISQNENTEEFVPEEIEKPEAQIVEDNSIPDFMEED